MRSSRLRPFQLMSARLVRNDGIAPDHRLPCGSFLLQMSGEELRRVEHRDQGLVIELLGEPRRLPRACGFRETWGFPFPRIRTKACPARACRARRAPRASLRAPKGERRSRAARPHPARLA